LLRAQSLDLTPLEFELPLLLGELCLGVCLLLFLGLHRTAGGKTSKAAQCTTDCGARAWRAYGRTD